MNRAGRYYTSCYVILWSVLWHHYLFKMAHPRPLFRFFRIFLKKPLFSSKFSATKLCSLQWDSNSYYCSRRWARWPLGPTTTSQEILALMELQRELTRLQISNYCVRYRLQTWLIFIYHSLYLCGCRFRETCLLTCKCKILCITKSVGYRWRPS